MELEVKEVVRVDEGKYFGTITKLEFRSQPYEYTDVYVRVDKVNKELKAGYPTSVSEVSALGKLLADFGVELVPGKKIDPEKVLVGKKCTFLVVNEKGKGKGGEFARIVSESLKQVK